MKHLGGGKVHNFESVPPTSIREHSFLNTFEAQLPSQTHGFGVGFHTVWFEAILSKIFASFVLSISLFP